MTTITKKPRLNTILPLAAVAMFASASVSNAAPVVYNLTVTTPAGFGGTMTLDIDNATVGGGQVEYALGSGVEDFSIHQVSNSDAILFTILDADANGFGDFDLVFSDGGTPLDPTDDTVLTWFGDIDDNAGAADGGGTDGPINLFGDIEFPDGGNIDTIGVPDEAPEDSPGYVTGAALTVATTPADVTLENPTHVSGTPDTVTADIDAAGDVDIFRSATPENGSWGAAIATVAPGTGVEIDPDTGGAAKAFYIAVPAGDPAP